MIKISTPWEKAQKRLKQTKPKHVRSEQRGAQGGALQINSGRFWHSKRDFRKFNFIFENRQTDSKTITVNAQELKKITRESIFENALPAMRLDFTDQGEDWTLLRTSDFTEFFEALKLLEAMLDGDDGSEPDEDQD